VHPWVRRGAISCESQRLKVAFEKNTHPGIGGLLGRGVFAEGVPKKTWLREKNYRKALVAVLKCRRRRRWGSRYNWGREWIPEEEKRLLLPPA